MSPDFFSALRPGARVVIRYRLGPEARGNAGEQFSDALGQVHSVAPTHVVLLTRGGTVSIERAKITHAKEVPPAPERRRRGRPVPPEPTRRAI